MKTTILYWTICFAASSYGADWRMFGHDRAHSSFVAGENKLEAGNLSSLQTKWMTSLGAPIASAPTVVDRMLYVGTWDGNFYALDARDGAVLWRQFVGKAPAPQDPLCKTGSIGVTSQAAVVGNTVYVGGGDSALYALDRVSGQQQWRLPLADPDSGSYIWSSVTHFRGALYVGVSSLGYCPPVRGALIRIDIQDPNNPIFKYLEPESEPGAGLWSTPAADSEADEIVITTGAGQQNAEKEQWGSAFISLDAKTLAVRANYFLPINFVEDDIEWGSSPTLLTTAGGTRMAIAAGKDGVLYAVRRNDWSLAWRTTIAVNCICPECGCGSLSTPAFDGTSLFAGAGVSDPDAFAGGTLYSLDPETGEVIWKRLTDGTIIAPVTVANGLVFAGTTKGLEISDARTGTLLWSHPNAGVVYSQPVVVDGILFATLLSGSVVAREVPRPLPERSPELPLAYD